MANLAIKGHPKRGIEVIERLEMLGGLNTFKLDGAETNRYYYIDSSNSKIYHCLSINPQNVIVYTLEEFLEKFPCKVGDMVKVLLITPEKTEIAVAMIEKIWWDEKLGTLRCDTDKVMGLFLETQRPYKEENYCQVIGNDTSGNGVNTSASLKDKGSINELNKVIFDTNAQCCDIMNDIIKKDMEQIKIGIPKGYEFFGINDDNKIVLTKKQPQYPKTYKECCKVVNASPYVSLVYDRFDGKTYSYDIDNLQIYENLRKLKICRDAYWKIAGEQMGLGKAWEPDLENEELYCIQNYNKQIIKSKTNTAFNKILIFPTKEMRDTFYENFKDLIEQCKELL